MCVLQTAFAIEYAVSELILRLDAAGMRYAEIRFAPQLHMQNGLTQQEIVEASLCGLQKGIGSSKHMKAQLILCCMRGEDNEQENEQTVHLAKAYLKKGVAAVDLAGAEGLYPTQRYQSLFALAARLDVPFTIHAGRGGRRAERARGGRIWRAASWAWDTNVRGCGCDGYGD